MPLFELTIFNKKATTIERWRLHALLLFGCFDDVYVENQPVA